MNAREQADPLGVSSDLLWWGSRIQLGLSNRTDQDALLSSPVGSGPPGGPPPQQSTAHTKRVCPFPGVHTPPPILRGGRSGCASGPSS